MAADEPRSANELALVRTEYAIDRTVMAANRTLMAWVRTALSYISFGFTIYKFLEATIKEGPLGLMTHRGRHLGLLLIALGTVSAVMGGMEYLGTVKSLGKASGKPIPLVRFPFISGMVIGLLGLFLFVTIAAHADVF